MSQAVKNIVPIKSTKNERICVIIPAAGSSMKSAGPKCLLKIGSKTLFEHQLDILRYNLPNFYTVLVTGFESNYVMDNTPDCIKIENERFEQTNALRSITMGLRAAMCNRVLIMYGDVICSKETLDFDYSKSAVFLDKKIEGDTVGAFATNTPISQLMYGLDYKWGQIAYLTGKELELFKKFAYKKDAERYFTFELINKIIDSNGSFVGVTNPKTKIHDIDCNKDIKRAQEIVYENCL